jgi:uncharacterized protein with beta-barrel porin domain
MLHLRFCLTRLSSSLLSFMAACLIALAMPAGVLAADYVVTTTNDSGAGSLREALASAGDGDRIVVAPGVSGTITLESVLPTLNSIEFVNAQGLSLYMPNGDGTTHPLVVGSRKTISGLLPGSITTRGIDQPSAIYGKGALTFADEMSAALSATSSDDATPTVIAMGDITFEKDVSGSIFAQSDASTYGLYTGGVLSLKSLSGSIESRGSTGGGMEGDSVTILGDLSGSIVAVMSRSHGRGIYSFHDVNIGSLSGSISASTKEHQAGGVYVEGGNLNIHGPLSGSIAVSAGTHDAYGLFATRNISLGDMSGDISVDAARLAAGMVAWNDLIIDGDMSGSLSVAAHSGKAVGIISGNAIQINGDLSGSVFVSASSSVHGFETEAFLLDGKMSGSLVARTNGRYAVGIGATGLEFRINDVFSGSVDVSAQLEAYGLRAIKAIALNNGLTGSVTAVAREDRAYGIFSEQDITISNALSGTVSATAGGSEAYGLYSQRTIQLGAMSGDISADAGAATAVGILAWDDVIIDGDMSGSISATTSEGPAVGVVSGDSIRINGDLSGSVFAASGDSAKAFDTNAFLLDGKMSASLVVRAGGRYGLGITATGPEFRIDDVFSGSVDVSAQSEAYGLKSIKTIALNNGLTGSVAAVARDSLAYGIFSEQDIAISNGLSGTVSATAGGAHAYGLMSMYGKIDSNGVPLAISGTVSASANGRAVAISAPQGLNLNVTGSLLATDSSGSGEAYAIRAGAYDWRTYDWIDGGAVDDTVVLGDGASVIGKIDLGGGTNLLTLDGAGSMSGVVSNITTMTKSGAGIWSTDGDITANALSVLGGTLNVNVDPASTSTVRVATDLAVQDATLKVNGSQAATSMHVANDLTLQDGSLVVNGSQGDASTMEVARDLIARSSAVTVNGSQAGSSMRVTNDFTLQDGSLVVNGAQGTASALHVANDLTLRNSTVTVDGAQAAAASMHVANNLTVQDCELTVTGSRAATPTMRIANDFALQGGKMQVGISQTDTPTVLVTNTFTNNSEVTFVLDGLVESGKTFTVLSSGNLLGGGTYDIDSMLLSTSVVGSNVNVTKKSYLDILDTTDDNALALATALDSLTGTATGDMATILAELENAPSQKAFTSYLDELSGLFSSGTTAMSLGTAQQLSLATQTRMAQMRTYQTFMARNEYAPDPEDPESWPMVASNGDLAGVMFRGPESRPNGVHLRMLGRTGLMDTHGGYDGYDYRSMLISGGYDRVLRDGLLVGVSGGYARTDADYKDVGKSDSSLDSYSLGFYGTWFDEQWYVDAMISAAYNKYESNRQIPAFARIAKSDSTGYTVSAKNAGGYRFDVGGFGLTPNISVEYTRFHQNGYTESGAGAANLTLPDVDSNFLESGLGLKLDRAWQTGFGQIIPEISASWMHEWFTQDKSLTVSMTGMPGTVFSQTTAQTARDAYRFGAGVRLLHDKGMSLALNYQGEVEEHASSHSLMCEAQFVF